MKKRIAAYLRVSTIDQTIENQRLAIESYATAQGWPVRKFYEDQGQSGAKHDRPGLNALRADVKAGKLDAVIVWKFDRLARSTAHLLQTLELLKAHDCDFVSVTEAIDTTTAAGKMVLTFLGAVAEFEREVIRERVNAGLDRARANGTKLGRPRAGFDYQTALALRSDGLSFGAIGRKLGVSKATVYRQLSDVSKTPSGVSA